MLSLVRRCPNGLNNIIKNRLQCAFKGTAMAPRGWYKYNDNVVFIREAEDHRKITTISLVFNYKNRMPPMEKTYAFFYSPDEYVEDMTQRIRHKISNEMRIRVKLGMTYGATEEEVKEIESNGLPEFEVSMVKETGEPIEGVNLNELFLSNSESTLGSKMKIQGEDYAVMFNGPFAVFMELPETIMVGDQCYPRNIKIEETTKEECEFQWFKALPGPENERNFEFDWQPCGDGFTYHVTKADIGYKLRVACIPKRGDKFGPTLHARSRNVIIDTIGGQFDAFADRHAFTSSRLPMDGDRFRVVSYNILADFYNDSKSSLSEWYPYCRPEVLNIDYRKKLCIREVRGYNSDIICLQEVDTKIFREDLNLLMMEDGLNGSMQRKGAMPEGMATFYDTRKFSLIWTGGFTVGDYLNGHPSMLELFNKIKENKPLCDRVLLLPTSLQLTLLKSKFHNRFLLVANTHLYAALDASHIRLLQAQAILQYIKYYRENRLKELSIPDERVSLIFCGDFNSQPDRGVFKLMTEKFVPSDYADFSSNETQAVKNLSLEHDFNFKSAYDTNIFTNYTRDFKGCLDYIFYEPETLKTVQTVPIPSEDILSMETALPSTYFSSDHIALVADIEWTLK